MRLSTHIFLSLFLGLTLLGACAESEMHGSFYDDDDDDAMDGGTGDDDDGPDDNSDDGLEDDEPEEENDFLTTEPRGTDVFVFVANPSRDTVSKIDAHTREIETIEVGDEPTQVLVSSDYLRAVTFNASADSVSVIDVNSNQVTELDVREDFNFIQMSPDGRWVVAYFNAAVEDASFDVSGVRSFTEVSFVDTVEKRVESYSVGFNPKEVKFTAAADRAIVISDSFMTVANLLVSPIELQLLDLLAFLLADGADRGAGVEPEPEP